MVTKLIKDATINYCSSAAMIPDKINTKKLPIKTICSIYLLILFVLAVCVTGCGKKTTETNNDTPSYLVSIESYTPGQMTTETLNNSVKIENYVVLYNDIVLDIYRYSVADDNIGNFVFGPYSFLQVLGMTAIGAKTETIEEIKKVFFAGQDADDWLNIVYHLGQSIAIVNQSELKYNKPITVKNIAWGHKNYLFSRDYLDKVIKYYAPELSAIDYSALGSTYNSYLNDWVSGVTSGHIKGMYLYSDTPQRTRLLLGNVVWLENTWGTNPDNIQFFEGIFERNNGVQYWVPMVRLQGMYNFYCDNTITAFELPIGSSDISMVVFMPGAGTFDSFSEELKERIPSIISALTPKNVEIVLPLFNFNSASYIDKLMKDFGVNKAFDEKSADFSGINGRGYCYLKNYLENATIGISKESVYAGSVTAAVFEATIDEPNDLWSDYGYGIFTFDGQPCCYRKEGNADARPFVFIIREGKTDAILYIGRLIDAGGKEAGSWVCPCSIAFQESTR
ncbi:MAG: serpin family protein [Nitrospira sp.]|nr:serpin family protein [Nitrospira sp.]